LPQRCILYPHQQRKLECVIKQLDGMNPVHKPIIIGTARPIIKT
jgi:hypothetical protein